MKVFSENFPWVTKIQYENTLKFEYYHQAGRSKEIKHYMSTGAHNYNQQHLCDTGKEQC
jgi:hypothetical protein